MANSFNGKDPMPIGAGARIPGPKQPGRMGFNEPRPTPLSANGMNKPPAKIGGVNDPAWRKQNMSELDRGKLFVKQYKANQARKNDMAMETGKKSALQGAAATKLAQMKSSGNSQLGG